MVSIAVLASGSGTNLQAIIDFTAKLGESATGSISLVACNRASAGALEKAKAAGIRAEVFDASDDGTALLALLQRNFIDLVVLAGYLRHLPDKVTSAYH